MTTITIESRIFRIIPDTGLLYVMDAGDGTGAELELGTAKDDYGARSLLAKQIDKFYPELVGKEWVE